MTVVAAAKIRSPLPPRPPLKRKHSMEASGSEKGPNPASTDSGVKVSSYFFSLFSMFLNYY